MNITKLQQEIQNAEDALHRMKEQLKEAEKMSIKYFYPESKSCKFKPELTLEIVDGDLRALLYAFPWDCTPQGNDYWDQKSSKSPITDEDKITLLRWCVNYYKAQTK